MGDKAEIIEKSLVGRILDVNWHIKDDVPFYLVEVSGKKSAKRYRDFDLKQWILKTTDKTVIESAYNKAELM